MKLYLAGPMRGIPLYNFPAFDAAAAKLRSKGYEVFSPADRDRSEGFDPSGGLDDFDLAAAMADDLRYIIDEADAIALLPGWENSTGARLERAVAEATGKSVCFYAEDCESLLFRDHHQVVVTSVDLIDGNGYESDETICEEADRLVSGERREDYGHPRDDFGRAGRMWGAILGIDDVAPEKVGLCMVALKIGREVNRHKRDNLVDMAGYAKTVDLIHQS